MKIFVCPKCKTINYMIIKAKNEKDEFIVEKFLCSCLYSGDVSELKKQTIFMKIRDYLHRVFIHFLFWRGNNTSILK